MAKQIFVNLPVKDLKKSVTFFTDLGFTFNATFTDDNATCMIVAENIHIMLLVEPFFRGFSNQEICDTSKANEVLVCLSVESKDELFDLCQKAFKAGGSSYKEPQDHGFMLQHGFKDLDGHIWEIVYMSGIPPQ